MTGAVKKMLAYVTDGDKLLVFRHRDFPEAGLQVPGGTVKLGEEPEAAVMREVEEETGLSAVRLVCLLGQYNHHLTPEDSQRWKRDEVQDRHVFHLKMTGPTSDEWLHHELHAEGEPPIAFALFWMALDDPELDLAGGQGDLLWMLRAPSPQG